VNCGLLGSDGGTVLQVVTNKTTRRHNPDHNLYYSNLITELYKNTPLSEGKIFKRHNIYLIVIVAVGSDYVSVELGL
jgi:hypothetical protein